MNISDLITPSYEIAYWDNFKANQDAYLGEVLFRPRKQLGTELNTIGGRAGLPVELKASAFDTQATLRDRLSVERRSQELAFFREGMTINEKIRQELQNYLMASNTNVIQPLINNIFDDTNNLLKGARVARERMAMELIASGKITVNANGVEMTYDFHIDEDNQKKQADTSWDDLENSNPLLDMQTWVDDFKILYGIPLGYAIMTTRTFRYIATNKNVIKQLYPTAYDPSGIMVKNDLIKNLIYDVVGIKVLFADGIYGTTVGGGGKKFYPDNQITLIPESGVLGDMVFGTTPEEADLNNGAKFNGSTMITDTGVAVTTILEPHPVNITTYVSQICLPSFTSNIEGGAGAILIADVVK